MLLWPVQIFSYLIKRNEFSARQIIHQIGDTIEKLSMKLLRNKIWWLCLVPTSTTRFANDVGYRMAKKLIGLYKEIFLWTMTSNSLIPRSHTRIFLTIPYGSPNCSQSQASVNNTLRSVYNSSQLGDIRNEPWKQRQIFWHVKNILRILRLPTDWFFRKSFGNNT